jgi:formate dehydrogenase iron-sulfur subunit
LASREHELTELLQTPDPVRGWFWSLLNRLIVPLRRGVPPEAKRATGFYTDTTVCIGCKACEVACKQWNQLPADGFEWSGNSYDNTGELSATSWRHVKFIEQFSEGEANVEGRGASEDKRDEGRGASKDKASRLSLPLISFPSPLAPEPSPLSNRWLMMSDVCKHCVAAPCQQACPTGALIHNEFENVYIQPDICNGCSYCVASCPFGVITRADFDGHAHKCTLCYDRQKDGLVPACAKACPTESIQFGPVEELRERARERVKELHMLGRTDAYLYGDEPTDTYSELHSFYILVDRPSVYGLPEKPFNAWLHMKGDYVRSIGSGLAAVAALLAVLLLLSH